MILHGWFFGRRSQRQMKDVDRENKGITKSDRYGKRSQAVFSFSRLFLEGGSWMYFKTADHQTAFNNLLEKAGQVESREYKAAVYALAAIGKDISGYILPGEIKYPAIFKEAEVWSSGEKALLRLSATLFDATLWKANLGDIFHHLDANNRQVAIQAIEIRYIENREGFY